MRRAVVVAFALVPALSQADEVFVRGGGCLSGEVVERGPESIVVDIGSGKIGLPLSYVDRIVPGTSPVGLYRERAAGLSPDDVAGWLALAEWSLDHDLLTKAREAFERVVLLDPRNVAAHRGLGHVLVGHEWMTLEESYRTRGYVRFEGTWVMPDERRAILEERVAAAEAERAQAESEVRIREAEARARLAEAEAQRAELDLRRAEVEAASFFVYPGSIAGVAPWFPPSFYPAFRPGFYAFMTGVGPYSVGFARASRAPERMPRTRAPVTPSGGRVYSQRLGQRPSSR